MYICVVNTKEKKKRRHKYIELLKNRIDETKRVTPKLPIHKNKEKHLELLYLTLGIVKGCSHILFNEGRNRYVFPDKGCLSIFGHRATERLEKQYNNMMESPDFIALIRDAAIDSLLAD